VKSEFKPGQTVVITGESNGHCFAIGSHVKIVEKQARQEYLVKGVNEEFPDGICQIVNSDSFEPIHEIFQKFSEISEKTKEILSKLPITKEVKNCFKRCFEDSTVRETRQVDYLCILVPTYSKTVAVKTDVVIFLNQFFKEMEKVGFLNDDYSSLEVKIKECKAIASTPKYRNWFVGNEEAFSDFVNELRLTILEVCAHKKVSGKKPTQKAIKKPSAPRKLKMSDTLAWRTVVDLYKLSNVNKSDSAYLYAMREMQAKWKVKPWERQTTLGDVLAGKY
jgi:hypothetical protein